MVRHLNIPPWSADLKGLFAPSLVNTLRYRRAPLQRVARRFILRGYGKALFQLLYDERWQIDRVVAGRA